MVGLILGLLLMGTLLQVYLGSKVTFRIQEGLSHAQDQGRLAMFFLTREARMGGFQGCAKLGEVNPGVVADSAALALPVAIDYREATVVRGHESTGSSTWSPALPAGLSGVRSGTDVVTIQHASECGAFLTGRMAAPTSPVVVTANDCALQAGRVYLVGDCSAANLFAATAVTGTGPQTLQHDNILNSTGALTQAFGSNQPDAQVGYEQAQVLSFQSATYYIANSATPGHTSLWRRLNDQATGAGNPQELVQGVEHLQILYGENTNGDAANTADTYVAANAVSNWANVVSLRVSLLVQTTEEVDSKTHTDTYDLLGTTVDPPDDRRLREVMVTTISLRNRQT
jgi:type IV pilus assembly protein PilW